MKLHTTKEVIARNIIGTQLEREFEIEITYYATKGSRGARDSFGVPLEPDEEPEIEIESVISVEDGCDIELTEKEQDKIKTTLWELRNEPPDLD